MQNINFLNIDQLTTDVPYLVCAIHGGILTIEFIPEHVEIEDEFSFENTGVDHHPRKMADKVERGAAVWVMVKLEFSSHNDEFTNYLCGCYDDSLYELYNSELHGYLSDMINNVLNEVTR